MNIDSVRSQLQKIACATFLRRTVSWPHFVCNVVAHSRLLFPSTLRDIHRNFRPAATFEQFRTPTDVVISTHSSPDVFWPASEDGREAGGVAWQEACG